MAHPHAQDSPDKDFFISYARADERWAEWIAGVLDTAGFAVAFDLRDLPAGRSAVQWMDDAIARSERILAVISPHYFDRRSFVGAEWPTAFSDRRRWDGRIVPVVVEECEAELAEHPLLGHLTPLRLTGLPEGRARTELVARLESSRSARYPGFGGGQRADGDQGFRAGQGIGGDQGGRPAPRADRRRAECFRIGPLRTTWRLVEGDGEEAITRENVRLSITPEFVELPEEMAAWRDEIAAEQAERRAKGLHALWNGKCYAVEGLGVSRTVGEEAPEVCLRLRHADYYTFLAT
ncbi:toll/interleukin-1 receptor domain-containing protein [Streptomyces sp. NPDC003717]|uniref:toll/interleukin-1 receptor domain-containing protein n=1 Tax=Streptomyces sp. NPDC003717 TaxID=3154276 RepID=UPI0033B56ED0